jgi:hypothetical protein
MARFLNVQFLTVKTRIRMDSIEDLSDLRRSIKQEFSDVFVCSPPFIQLFDEQGNSIHTMTRLKNLPDCYFEEEGPSLLIRIASSSNLDLIDHVFSCYGH